MVKSHGSHRFSFSSLNPNIPRSPQTSNFEALLQGGESQRGAMSAGPRSYRYDSTESGDAFGDVDIDERERSKVLGAIKAKVAGHYGR